VVSLDGHLNAIHASPLPGNLDATQQLFDHWSFPSPEPLSGTHLSFSSISHGNDGPGAYQQAPFAATPSQMTAIHCESTAKAFDHSTTPGQNELLRGMQLDSRPVDYGTIGFEGYPQASMLLVQHDTIQSQSSLLPTTQNATCTPNPDNPPLAAQINTQSTPTAGTQKRGNTPKAARPRLRCTYAGCKSTFPRKYELHRHLTNFHQRINIPCMVYGCNRIGKPVARVDKFREHMRQKHGGAHAFVCAVEACAAGPFDRIQLCQHLNAVHNLDSCHKELSVKERLRGISLRISLRDDGTRFYEENGNCPLAFLGCSFHVPHVEGPFGRSAHKLHIRTHDIVDRAKGYQALLEQGYDAYYVGRGEAACPVCLRLVSHEYEDVRTWIKHLLAHSVEERRPYIVEIWKCILSLKMDDRTWNHDIIKIREEYQVAINLNSKCGEDCIDQQSNLESPSRV
jgi:hypothetical protein